jgi:putative toxin-antitoxin system antitoxin component (TIGR02293 family)
MTFVVTMDDIMVNELQAVVDELGGEAVLGGTVRSAHDMMDAIRRGFHRDALRSVAAAAGISVKDLAACVDLSYRTIQRLKPDQRLGVSESDRLYRLMRIAVLANDYIGDHEKASRWLQRPNKALGGDKPIELLDTELGARMVEDILGRIAYGGVS